MAGLKRAAFPICLSRALALASILLIAAVGWSACECFHPPWVAVDGYSGAEVQTWQDTDGDGAHDLDEGPLPWVTVRMAHEQSITDSGGQGGLDVFKPGCPCRCWEGEMVSAMVPPGYRATTPTQLALTGQDLSYGFGFQREEGVRLANFSNEPGWFQAFLNRGLALRDFHYAPDSGLLALSFEGVEGPDQDALYREIFEVIFTLEAVAGILVEWVEITTPPPGEAVTCGIAVVEEWWGRLSAGEIVTRYCREAE